MTNRAGVARESFYVGGSYVGEADSKVMVGQMYVERLTPSNVVHEYPIVFLHGRGQTAANWLTTPDGRPGWAEFFTERGWEVVLIDQPARGRSAWQPDRNGSLEVFPTALIESVFTAPSKTNRWPLAKLHSQWPGTGVAGDAIFDQYYASLVPSLDRDESEHLVRDAGAALLDRIGPAILVGHSQGGLQSFLIADARPDRVKAIVALEPSGPPVHEVYARNASTAIAREYGLTAGKLTYERSGAEEHALAFERETRADAPDRVACWLQTQPPARLVNLSRVPMTIVTSEASYHAMFDHCTVRYLQQAGVNVRHLRLADVGIHGNGHMMMLERNSEAIAARLERCIDELIAPATTP